METKICVVGLGYVGLPLALEFAKVFPTTGFDINEKKIGQLKQGIDPSGEIPESALKDTKLNVTSDPKEISYSSFIIVAVPTPVDKESRPDLSYVESASELVAKHLKKGSIVVYESTVFPGCTEEICLPILKKSKLDYPGDFQLGYSPERVNPGDSGHTISNIIKVVSGDSKESTAKIAETYRKIIKAGIFIAKDIKTAEAAKVIENIQRDLNIALVNELSLIFGKLDIDTNDVLEAASTKWNFHKYVPGLVGGHCIGVDPYYLTYKAQQLGFDPKVILAGRSTNEGMSGYVAEKTISLLKKAGKSPDNSKVFILGLTFKENVSDPRNSKAKDLITHLQLAGAKVQAYDPLLDNDTVQQQFKIPNTRFNDAGQADAVILVTPHAEFRDITLQQIMEKMDLPIFIDIKSVFRKEAKKQKDLIYFTL